MKNIKKKDCMSNKKKYLKCINDINSSNLSCVICVLIHLNKKNKSFTLKCSVLLSC